VKDRCIGFGGSSNLSQRILPPSFKGGSKDGAFNVAPGFFHLLVESSAAPGKGLGICGPALTSEAPGRTTILFSREPARS
jgi:hypothetical protein